MWIKTIAATGLKGLGFRHQMAPVTLVAGDNGAGKSALVDGIKLGLLDRHPSLPNRASGIMQLASGNLLEVELELEGASEKITRRWTRKGKACSSEAWQPCSNLPEILELVPESILDFTAFMNAKPTERQRILEAAMGEAEDATPAIREAIAQLGDLEDYLTQAADRDDYRSTWQQLERGQLEASRRARARRRMAPSHHRRRRRRGRGRAREPPDRSSHPARDALEHLDDAHLLHRHLGRA